MGKFTYENQGSSKFLIYHLQEREELDTMALGMLSHNRIPNLLPVSFTQVDSERYLRYSELSQNTLKGQMSGMMTKNRLLTVLDSICDAILSSEEYLLDGNAFVLDVENMYVDGETGRTSLVYLPVLDTGDHPEYAGFFKSIITDMMIDPSEDGSYITKLLYNLNATENFSLGQFSKLVKNLKRTAGDFSERGREEMLSPVNNHSARPRREELAGSARGKADPKQTDKGIIRPVTEKSTGIKIEKKKETEEKSVPKPLEKTLPEKKTDGSYGFDIPGKSPVSSPIQSSPEQETPKADPEEKISMLHLLRNFSGENLEKYKQQGAKKTAEKSGAGKKKAGRKGGRQLLRLISETPAHPMTITVDKEVFHIGRKETNDAVLSNIHPVSREHFSIVQEKGAFYVIDRKSRFGTKVDGVSCIPGQKSVALQAGSIIELPEIRFRVEFD